MSFASLPPSLLALCHDFHQRYAILEEVGVGGSGVCLRVQRRRDGFQAVAKIIAKDRVGPQALVRTSQWGSIPQGFTAEDDGTLVVPVEAYALRRIRHANVVSFVDLFSCPTFYYIVMEYHGSAWRIETREHPSSYLPSPPVTPPAQMADFPRTPSEIAAGTPSPRRPSPTPLPPAPLMRRSSSDLFEAIEKHRYFSEHLACVIFFQIIATVYDLFKIGICHRDIKDENVVVDANCQVKLVDFGSCILFDPSKPAPIQHEQRFFGTSTYAAPEVFAGKSYSIAAAEAWSLGILLSTLLTSEHPFLSPADAAANKRLPIKVPLSPAARDLMDRCLTVDVEKRITLEQLRFHPWVVAQQGKP
ncbi:hypothetical protein JCM8547_006212 [Rhodosporidiobolus lusitaniae]